MTPCAKVVAWLPLFVGEDLEPVHAAAVRTHLRDCAACRRQASTLQQSVKALRGLAGTTVPGVDEAMFASMHERIVAAVQAEAAPEADFGRRWWVRWPVSAAAAVLLFVGGWALVRGLEPASLLDRPALATPGGSSSEVRVVPWSGGGRVPLQALGHQAAPTEVGTDPAGSGMMGRWRLRTLEDVELPPPEGAPTRR